MKRAEFTPLGLSDMQPIIWTTLRKSIDLRAQFHQFYEASSAYQMSRTFFRKVIKGFDENDSQLAQVFKKIEVLEAKFADNLFSSLPHPLSVQLQSRFLERAGTTLVLRTCSSQKELAEIIATRQRRERAWHARLLIYSTVISYIDSTLAAFEDEIENEEAAAAAFKAYFELAIANSAAADSSPTPPKIPSRTRPMKISGYGSGKDKNIMKKGAIAIHRDTLSGASNEGNIQEAQKLVEIPQISDKTWAT
ncbi:hypothetical protein EPUL_005061, partial [Erysiphe pulchra]